MKRTAIVIAVLGACTWSLGQSNTKPATQNPPAGQAAGQTPGQTPGQAATPPGKRPPQAKTKEEMDGYNAARAITDLAAQEKAADDFAAKFPDSELRPLVYKMVMQRYQQANNGDKMIEMAHKVLAIDPDDPEALVGIAQVEAEQTRDADLDKDQKVADAKKNAERALVTVDTDVPTTGYQPEQLAAYKGFLRSQAYFVLGTLSFKAKNWSDAEANLRKSIDALPQQPDEIAVYRLAVSLDMQSKYPEALKVVQQAVELTKDRADSPVGKAVRDEQDRLTKLNTGSAPGAPKN
jgi:tetratricopeptide (TPR) repeat protein